MPWGTPASTFAQGEFCHSIQLFASNLLKSRLKFPSGYQKYHFPLTYKESLVPSFVIHQDKHQKICKSNEYLLKVNLYRNHLKPDWFWEINLLLIITLKHLITIFQKLYQWWEGMKLDHNFLITVYHPF